MSPVLINWNLIPSSLPDMSNVTKYVYKENTQNVRWAKEWILFPVHACPIFFIHAVVLLIRCFLTVNSTPGFPPTNWAQLRKKIKQKLDTICKSTIAVDLGISVDVYKTLEKMFKFLERQDFKILLLGAENSGKTTFLNKMRFMFGHQLSQEDMEKYKKMILNQLVTSMQTLILDLALLGLEFDSEGEFTSIQ